MHEELSSDAEDIFAIVMCDAEFQGIMEQMKQAWDVTANINGAEEEETRIARYTNNSIDVEMVAWIGTLDKKGLVLAPVSSLPVQTRAPPAAAKTAQP